MFLDIQTDIDNKKITPATQRNKLQNRVNIVGGRIGEASAVKLNDPSCGMFLLCTALIADYMSIFVLQGALHTNVILLHPFMLKQLILQ